MAVVAQYPTIKSASETMDVQMLPLLLSCTDFWRHALDALHGKPLLAEGKHHFQTRTSKNNSRVPEKKS